MAHTIIDWQADSLIGAKASGRGSGVKLTALAERTFGAEQEHGDAKGALVGVAQELGLGKSEATVLVGRENVEMRTISVPRLDRDELPEVIRFQAQRQLANMGERWTLDYVLLPDDGQEMLTALVAAIGPEKLAGIENACAAANIAVERIAFRPIEIARFATSSSQLPGTGAALVLCISRQNADLILVKEGKVVLVRNTLLPSESELASKALSGEIRRSLIACSNQMSGAEIDQVLLLASEEVGNSFVEPVGAATGAPVTVASLNSVLPQQQQELAVSSGNRIAGICGAAQLAYADKAGVIDFKAPKKRPPKKKNTTTYVLAAAAAIVLALVGLSWWINKNNSLDEELAELEIDNEGKAATVERANDKVKKLAEIEAFAKSSPQFLDEFAEVAERIPDSDKVILAGPSFSTLSDGTGQIRVNIAADSADTISDFEESLRDKHRTVAGRDPRVSSKPTDLYKWEATETISIRGRGWDLVEKISSRRVDPATSQDTTSESPDEGAEASEEAAETAEAAAGNTQESDTADKQA